MRALLAARPQVNVQFSSEEEFEKICVKNASKLFWSWIDSGTPIYKDLKPMLRSKAGKATVPDGFLVWLDEEPAYSTFSFVEYELATE